MVGYVGWLVRIDVQMQGPVSSSACSPVSPAREINIATRYIPDQHWRRLVRSLKSSKQFTVYTIYIIW